MPPALSDEEGNSSSLEEIPAKKGKRSKKEPEPEEVEEEDEVEAGEDEYIVEKIVGHRISKGQVEYDVKWEGFDNPSDRTWEPESNLEGAIEILNDYLEQIGGRPEVKGKKRKGRKSGAESQSATPSASAKRLKKEKEWSPPPGLWEEDVDHVDTVEEQVNPETGKKVRYAYLVWLNHKKTQHPLPHVYQKCPQKMLQYYESHLVFSHNDPDTNGDMGMEGVDDIY